VGVSGLVNEWGNGKSVRTSVRAFEIQTLADKLHQLPAVCCSLAHASLTYNGMVDEPTSVIYALSFLITEIQGSSTKLTSQG
jgi:hypothetical protein